MLLEYVEPHWAIMFVWELAGREKKSDQRSIRDQIWSDVST